DLYGAEHSEIYVENEAREDRVKSEAGRFKILQFATHGVFNDANPLYSYLLLTPNAASGDDGLLEARELMILNLSADLVVLSACETARGRVSAGEGLTGMTWALFIAGAPSAVASQWKVSSAGTTEIMLNFHRNLLNKNISPDKAAALRLAELDFLRKGTFRHPFYWAGFILIGNDL
ncbi:MAG: CHAT domain-containing protein, partial [Acidobacteriota bacterium]|nr:CHAT domain-containing protein [Acidobacteriota bacterium]